MTLAEKLAIDPSSDRAPFEQVRLGIIELISTGALLAGERLPTVRALATDLNLASNTVARSYRELEAADVIETRGRQGSFVKAGRSTTLDAAARATVEHVTSLRELGVDDETIVSLVQRVVRGA
ncbi:MULTISPECIES: GntR family transcriptional regulator [unclassified Gordonia (in: high G+C Gram-positive bacteria)]|uniref:GntR family transcriptional regulator n=1 Tax=unclassified Gordonia (in: high G+C Gram-positive bacteria) TaxID=2657482 RepID=UPI001F116F57|nr:GntR family transcriptional regulator [Gordonia sp. ABSL49_1]MCH5641949.1 GntR family transcriptional regulator [Gordonia sp. ABSL49_1]